MAGPGRAEVNSAAHPPASQSGARRRASRQVPVRRMPPAPRGRRRQAAEEVGWHLAYDHGGLHGETIPVASRWPALEAMERTRSSASTSSRTGRSQTSSCALPPPPTTAHHYLPAGCGGSTPPEPPARQACRCPACTAVSRSIPEVAPTATTTWSLTGRTYRRPSVRHRRGRGPKRWQQASEAREGDHQGRQRRR